MSKALFYFSSSAEKEYCTCYEHSVSSVIILSVILRCRDLFIVMLNVVALSRVGSFAKLASVKLGGGEAL